MNRVKYGAEVLSIEWQIDAACKGSDPDVFYADSARTKEQNDTAERIAKAICFGCVVREECLDYAIANGEKTGTWGGLNEKERRTEAKARGAQSIT